MNELSEYGRPMTLAEYTRLFGAIRTGPVVISEFRWLSDVLRDDANSKALSKMPGPADHRLGNPNAPIIDEDEGCDD